VLAQIKKKADYYPTQSQKWNS